MSGNGLAHERSSNEQRLGAVVRLPADEELAMVVGAGLTFVVVDLVDGPYDEASMHRLVLAASAAGISVVARPGTGVGPKRLEQMGVAVVDSSSDGRAHIGTAGELAVVATEASARQARSRGAAFVALDLPRSVVSLLAAFAATCDIASERDELVLLPGMLGDARVFEDVVAALPPRVSSRGLRIDLDDSIEELAQSVLAAAPSRFGLVGHSLGGIVALEVARHAPRRLTRLALLNTSARAASAAQLDAWATLRDRTESGDFERVVQEQAVANLGRHSEPALVGRWVEMAKRVGPDGFVRQLHAQACRPESLSLLASIDVPTLVLSGSDDAVCPPELQREMAARIPGADHVTVDGAGHMSPLDHPDDVAVHLAAWL